LYIYIYLSNKLTYYKFTLILTLTLILSSFFINNSIVSDNGLFLLRDVGGLTLSIIQCEFAYNNVKPTNSSSNGLGLISIL
jgi:hypothetical protein